MVSKKTNTNISSSKYSSLFRDLYVNYSSLSKIRGD